MSTEESEGYEISRHLDAVIRVAVKIFQRENKGLYSEIIKSPYQIYEAVDYDNLDGGIWGHNVTFYLPDDLFADIFDALYNYEQEIKTKLNTILKIPDEYIYSISLSPDYEPIEKAQTGQAISKANYNPTQSLLQRYGAEHLWESDFFRLFISHKVEVKDKAHKLKEYFKRYGISCFVAHDDIKPTREWQDEIKKALFTMDGILAIFTKDFNKSEWTDQELGVAVGREVFVVPVRAGKDPYGFIGVYQGINWITDNELKLVEKIVDLLWERSELNLRLGEGVVAAYENAPNFDRANSLIKYIEKIKYLSRDFLDRLEKAPDNNDQVGNSYEVVRLPGIIKRLKGGLS